MLYTNLTKVDGVACAFVRRNGTSGSYLLVFERGKADLDQIEAINWARPTVTGEGAKVLPAGYGFELKDITYSHSDSTYRVIVAVAQQYLGDVTGYQEQVAELTTTVEQQAGELAAKDATIAEQTAAMEEKDAAIAQLEAAGSAAALKEEMAEAYTEGVETVG